MYTGKEGEVNSRILYPNKPIRRTRRRRRRRRRRRKRRR
jgi:hypothetical protein